MKNFFNELFGRPQIKRSSNSLEKTKIILVVRHTLTTSPSNEQVRVNQMSQLFDGCELVSFDVKPIPAILGDDSNSQKYVVVWLAKMPVELAIELGYI